MKIKKWPGRHGTRWAEAFRNGAKQLVLGGLALVLTGCGGGGGGGGGDSQGTITDRNFMPTTQGASWVYQHSNGFTSQSQIVGDATVDGASGVLLRSTQSGYASDTVLVKTASGVREYYRGNDPLSSLIGSLWLYRLPARPGESFEQVSLDTDAGYDIDGDGRNERTTLRITTTTIGLEDQQSAAGRFAECLHVRTLIVQTLIGTRLGDRYSAETTVDEWYAADVGRVRDTYTFRQGSYVESGSSELTAYRVGDRKSDLTPPRVTQTAPLADALVGPTSIISATFSEALDVTQIDASSLQLLGPDGQPVAGRVSISGSMLLFTPAVALTSGRYTGVVSPQVRDLFDNALGAPHRWQFTVDATVPSVVSTLPLEGGSVVERRPGVVVQFSEPLDATSVPSASFFFVGSQGGSISGTAALDGSTLTVTPTGDLVRGERYQLYTYGGLRDLAGNALPINVLLNFSIDPGRFAAPVSAASGLDVLAVAIGDIDGDGLNDALFATSYGSTTGDGLALHVRRGEAGGGLAPVTRLIPGPMMSCLPSNVQVRDLDADGRSEILVSGSGCGVQVYRRQSDGSWAAGQYISENGASRFRLFDVNGDGRLDLVMPLSASDDIGVWAQDVSGTFVFTRRVVVGAGVLDLEVGDLNGDGRADIVATTGGSVVVMAQQADGSFSAPVQRSTGSLWSSQAVAIGDLNGDGRNDIVASISSNSPTYLAVYYQQADGSIGPLIALPSYDIPFAIKVLDVDQDGRADIVVSHQGWMRVGLYRQRSDGTLQEEALYPGPYGNWNAGSLAVGDLTQDGRPDVLLVDQLLVQRPLDAAGPLSVGSPSAGRSRWVRMLERSTPASAK